MPYSNLGVLLSGPRQVFGVDVTGPYHESPSGYRYCLEVVDYYSGYGYSFLMKSKSEGYRHFMALILRLENAEIYPRRIYGYVSDHGGDTIMSTSFQEFLRDRGSYWQTAPRETPNYNALVERNIQTKKSIMRSLHYQSQQGDLYWTLTSDVARIFLNRQPRSSNPNKCTPYEAYMGAKPDLSTL